MRFSPTRTDRPACAGVLLVLAGALHLAAAPLELRHGPMALSFDESSGALLRVECRGEEIARVPAGAPPLTFGVGPVGKAVWFEQMGLARKLVKQARPAPGRLELTVAAGPYEFVERYRLYESVARLDRSARLSYHGAETQRLRGVVFRTPGLAATSEGVLPVPRRLAAPGSSVCGHATRPQTLRPRHDRPGGRPSCQRRARCSGPVSPRTSRALSSPRRRGRFEVRQSLGACGYLRPNEPQEFGFVTLQAVEGGYWTALSGLWNWMDSAGLRTPADRPEWVADGILYSFHPGGSIGSGFKDLGGFAAAAEKLLPALPRLGVNAVWVLPIEYKSPYWPLDYYRFADGLGSAAEYRKLVDTAHGLGLRVWQDLVPHGGAPQAVHNVAHPEFMLQREDGSHLDYWLNDFKLPAWQRFMADVAAHYMTNYGLDGFRVDACGGSKEPNWNPAIPYARASLGTMQGGLEMMQGIRAEVRRANPRDGAVLAEVESTRQIGVVGRAV